MNLLLFMKKMKVNAALTDFTNKIVKISSTLHLKSNNEIEIKEIKESLLHEMIHIIIWQNFGTKDCNAVYHGLQFKKKMKEINF